MVPHKILAHTSLPHGKKLLTLPTYGSLLLGTFSSVYSGDGRALVGIPSRGGGGGGGGGVSKQKKKGHRSSYVHPVKLTSR